MTTTTAAGCRLQPGRGGRGDFQGLIFVFFFLGLLLVGVVLHGIVADSARNVTGQVYEDSSAASDMLGYRLLPQLIVLFGSTIIQWFIFA